MATKKKELLEQEAPVTETVMSEGETLPVSYTHLDVYKRQDLAGSDIEHHAKCIERSHKMLKLLDFAVELLRTKHKNGEACLLYTSRCV